MQHRKQYEAANTLLQVKGALEEVPQIQAAQSAKSTVAHQDQRQATEMARYRSPRWQPIPGRPYGRRAEAALLQDAS